MGKPDCDDIGRYVGKKIKIHKGSPPIKGMIIGKGDSASPPLSPGKSGTI